MKKKKKKRGARRVTITKQWQWDGYGSPPGRAVNKLKESDTPYHQQTSLTDY